MQHIKNVIFDLGGVIMNLHFDRTHNAFNELIGQDFKEIFAQHKQDPVIDQYETGRSTTEEFRDGLREIFGMPELADDTIDNAWNAMLGDIPKERIEFVKKVGKEKRVFLLSNTNALHKTYFDKVYSDTVGGGDIEELFEQAYYSHTSHDRKPNVSIFQMVCNENGLNPIETVFIDDTLQHVEGARKAGLEAIHLQSPTTILDLGLI